MLKKQSKKCIDWRQLETHTKMIRGITSHTSRWYHSGDPPTACMDDFMSGWIEESPAAPVTLRPNRFGRGP